MGGELGQTAQLALSVAALGVLLLLWGGWQMFKRGDRQKAVLMIVCAVVVAGNILIWTL